MLVEGSEEKIVTPTNQQRPALLAAVAVIAIALSSGCDKPTTTSTTTPKTTTTATPTPKVEKAMDKTADAVADTAVTTKVKTALLADPDVKGLQISVETNNGVVSLTGAVDKAGNVERAAAVAKGVEGVKSVNNRLTVKPS